jgi:hypothetical protein
MTEEKKFIFSENRLVYFNGAAPAGGNEQPKPQEAVPVQPEAVKSPEQVSVAPDAPAQENAKTKEEAAKRFDAARAHLDTLAKITVS